MSGDSPSLFKAPEVQQTIDSEKQANTTDEWTSDLLVNEYGDNGAHLLDAHLVYDKGLKTSDDGKTILIPQPSDDPNDPLNWSRYKKGTILAVLSISAAMPDIASSVGVVTVLPQAMWVFLLSS